MLSAPLDLQTTLTGGAAAPFLDLLAVRGPSGVQFYVNGVLKPGIITTNLPSSAASIYEVRTENGASAQNAVLQVGSLTVGLPMF